MIGVSSYLNCYIYYYHLHTIRSVQANILLLIARHYYVWYHFLYQIELSFNWRILYFCYVNASAQMANHKLFLSFSFILKEKLNWNSSCELTYNIIFILLQVNASITTRQDTNNANLWLNREIVGGGVFNSLVSRNHKLTVNRFLIYNNILTINFINIYNQLLLLLVCLFRGNVYRDNSF